MERSISFFSSLFLDYMQQSSNHPFVLMFEMFFCLAGYVNLYLLATLNNDFLSQLNVRVDILFSCDWKHFTLVFKSLWW